MAETEFVSPWADPPTPPAPPPATVRGPSLAWNLISTAALFAWLGLQMGWVWGLAGVVGVFVHEYGHVLVINRLGCGPSTIRIIPFFGGAATVPRAPDTDFKGVLIALAGPAFGMIAALPFLSAALITGDSEWMGAIVFIAGLNLLNLLPAPPLDGAKALGPALARIHPLVERLALAAVGAAAVAWTISQHQIITPIFISLGVLAALRTPRLRAPARSLSPGEWLASLGLYAGVAALCAGVLVYALPRAHLSLPAFGLGGRS